MMLSESKTGALNQILALLKAMAFPELLPWRHLVGELLRKVRHDCELTDNSYSSSLRPSSLANPQIQLLTGAWIPNGILDRLHQERASQGRSLFS